MGDLLRHSFSDLLTTGSPPGGVRGNAPDKGDDAPDLTPLSIVETKENAGGSPPAFVLSFAFPKFPQEQKEQGQQKESDQTVTVPLRASAKASLPVLTNRSHPSALESAETKATFRSAAFPNSEEVQRAKASLVPIPTPRP